MARLDMLRPYVEKVVAEYLGIPPDKKLVVNDDGSIPIHVGSAMYYVQLMEGEPAILQVYSVMIEELDKSPELFEALNEINRTTYYAKVFWLDDHRVVAASEIVADTADKGEIGNACNAIAWVADHYDTELQKKFGGKMSFTDEAPAKPEDAPADV